MAESSISGTRFIGWAGVRLLRRVSRHSDSKADFSRRVAGMSPEARNWLSVFECILDHSVRFFTVGRAGKPGSKCGVAAVFS